jgi:hypothetical protein
MSSIVEKIREFHQSLDRQEFYDFYELMTALPSPACGDKLYFTDVGTTVNLKQIIRRLRITVMYPRFNVDYATAYTRQEAFQDLIDLKAIYPRLSVGERNAVSKIIGALEVITKAQPAEKTS